MVCLHPQTPLAGVLWLHFQKLGVAMSTKQILINLIEEANGQRLNIDADLVDFFNPLPDVRGQHNTQVTLVGKPESGYVGSVAIYYRRYDLAEDKLATAMQAEQALTAELLMTLINRHTTLPVTWDDLETIDIPSMQVGDIYRIDVIAKPNSLAWTGAEQVSFLCGLPENSDTVFDIMNSVLPNLQPVTPP